MSYFLLDHLNRDLCVYIQMLRDVENVLEDIVTKCCTQSGRALVQTCKCLLNDPYSCIHQVESNVRRLHANDLLDTDILARLQQWKTLRDFYLEYADGPQVVCEEVSNKYLHDIAFGFDRDVSLP